MKYLTHDIIGVANILGYCEHVHLVSFVVMQSAAACT